MKVRHALQVVIVLLCGLSGAFAATPAEGSSCKAKFREVAPVAMKLPSWDFDQSESGWRKLGNCDAEAAQLLRLYIEQQESDLRNLHWHLAQSLAFSGENQRAIDEAVKSLKPEEAKQQSNFSWNTYVQATVEFLRNDRPAFDVQYEAHRLATVKNPKNQTNLEVLAGLAKCFGRSYKEAYASCRNSP